MKKHLEFIKQFMKKALNYWPVFIKTDILFLFILFTTFSFYPLNAQSFQWANKAEGKEIHGNCIDVDVYGNSYVAGEFYETISIGSTTLNNPGLWSIFIAKYDFAGALILELFHSNWLIPVGFAITTLAESPFKLTGISISLFEIILVLLK